MDRLSRKLLLTGAAGRIGSAYYAHARDRYAFRLADRAGDAVAEMADGDDEALTLDVADLEACRAACAGIDTVIHLAADPSPGADFYGSLLDNNIKGTYNIFQAASDQGCRRVVYASSVHAVLGYLPETQPQSTSPVRPLNMYGVSKCFGEAVAARFAYAEGLSSIAIRIGAYDTPKQKGDTPPRYLDAYLSPRDMNQLLDRCIEADNVRFAIVHGISNNRFKAMDLSATRDLLGYEPQDDAFEMFTDWQE